MNATETITPQPRKSFRFSRRQSIALVAACTVFGAAAQILIKSGANILVGHSPVEMLMNVRVVGGYSLYGISTMLLVLALRDGELSILYPVISLTYVWVTMLSLAILHESVNPFKILGVAIIVLGVAILGRNNKR